MPDGSGLTETRYRRSLSALVGRRLTSVVHYGLRYAPQHGVQWDFDQWHHPEMGVELVLDDGSVYSAVWGDAFGHFDLELVCEPMRNLLVGVGEPDGPRVWEVTTHPRWAALLGEPIRDAQLVWNDDAVDEGPVPVAVRLRFSQGDVWLVAGEPVDWPPAGRFYLAMDEVLVIFTRDLAGRLGLT
jgi:hypothetical protein